MARNILVGLGAGLAAALLFASLISGTALAFPLFLLSPLPIAIASLGFGTLAGAAAALLASALIAAAFLPIAGGLYLLILAGPIAWTAHLAGLSRPTETQGQLEWFPLDAVLFRAALIVGVALVIAGIVLGFDPEALVAATLEVVKHWVASSPDAQSLGNGAELEPYIRFNVAAMPFTTAAFALLVIVFDTWLAGRIVRMSGQLARPWTPLFAVSLPPSAAALLAAAIVVSLAPGPAGHAAGALAGALGFAFALSGFGALHALLLGHALRPAALVLAYALSFVFVLPILAMAALGIADSFLHFRARRLAVGTGSK